MLLGHPQLEARQEVPRRGGEDLLEAFPRLRIVAQRQVAQAQIAARQRIVRVAGQQASQHGAGLVETPLRPAAGWHFHTAGFRIRDPSDPGPRGRRPAAPPRTGSPVRRAARAIPVQHRRAALTIRARPAPTAWSARRAGAWLLPRLAPRLAARPAPRPAPERGAEGCCARVDRPAGCRVPAWARRCILKRPGAEREAAPIQRRRGCREFRCKPLAGRVAPSRSP